MSNPAIGASGARVELIGLSKRYGSSEPPIAYVWDGLCAHNPCKVA